MFRIDQQNVAGSLPAPAAVGSPGFFQDPNPAGSQAGTQVTADWYNAVQEELIAVIVAGGGTPNKTVRTQVRDAIVALIAVGASAASIQAQAGNYAAAGGTANAITATYTPAVSAHTVGMPLRVKIGSNNTGGVTFNPGPGVKTVVDQFGSALLQNDLVAGDIVEFKYDGTNYIYKDSMSAVRRAALSATGSAVGIVITNNAGTPNTQIDCTVASAVLVDANGTPFAVGAASATIDLSSNGAINKLDTGAIAANTVYYIWEASNGSTTGFMASLQSAVGSVVFPAGYIYRKRIGAMITNGSSQLYRTLQVDRDVQYIVGTNPAAFRQLATGAQGTPGSGVYVGVTVAANSGANAFVPLTAKKIKVTLSWTNNAATAGNLAANTNYGTGDSLLQPVQNGGGGGSADVVLESTQIFINGTAVGAPTWRCAGWTDSI